MAKLRKPEKICVAKPVDSWKIIWGTTEIESVRVNIRRHKQNYLFEMSEQPRASKGANTIGTQELGVEKSLAARIVRKTQKELAKLLVKEKRQTKPLGEKLITRNRTDTCSDSR